MMNLYQQTNTFFLQCLNTLKVHISCFGKPCFLTKTYTCLNCPHMKAIRSISSGRKKKPNKARWCVLCPSCLLTLARRDSILARRCHRRLLFTSIQRFLYSTIVRMLNTSSDHGSSPNNHRPFGRDTTRPWGHFEFGSKDSHWKKFWTLTPASCYFWRKAYIN